MEGTIFLFVFLFMLAAFFSGTEIAFFSLSPGAVRTMVRKKEKFSALVEHLLKKPRRLLITILIGSNLVNIFTAAIATQLALSLYGSRGVGIATGVVTLLVLVFGEIFPKTVAQAYARTMSRTTAPILYVLSILLFPFVWIFIQLTNVLMHIIPGGFKKRPIASEEDIRSLFYIGVEEGSIEKKEQDFIERLFKFNDITVKSAFTHIENVVMLDGEQSTTTSLQIAAHSGYSRFPVYVDNTANITGFVHIKDIVSAVTTGKKDTTLKKIVRKAIFIDEGMLLDDVFYTMQQHHTHYLFARDKDKIILGIISLEDILEELIGEIYDEFYKQKQVTNIE